jgi:hypothetical protein
MKSSQIQSQNSFIEKWYPIMYFGMNFSAASNFASKGTRLARLAAVGLLLLISRSTHAGIIESFEKAGQQTSYATNTSVIDFNIWTANNNTPYDDSKASSINAGELKAAFTGAFYIHTPNINGGAVDPTTGKDTNYFAVHSGDAATVVLSSPQAYFGLWVSSADGLNQITFYNGDKVIGSTINIFKSLSTLPSIYNGDPTPQFKGADPSEKYAFVNFSAQTAADKFNKVVLSNLPGGSIFESDNFTFSTTLQSPSSVPEPSSLALLGLGVCGLTINAYLRTRNSITKP